jgi:SPP1 gp7 family putative phage head morphogenesis protein
MKHYITDGVKSTFIDNFPDEAWTSMTPAGNVARDSRADTRRAQYLYESVGWLYRCVELRANSASRVPWAITRGDSEVWLSRDAQPPAQLSHLAKLKRLIYLSEAALCLAPEAFWFNERNRARSLDLRWLAPTSVLPVWDETLGLVGFDRRMGNGQVRRFDPADIVYFPRPNPMHETEPGRPPAQAAMSAGGVLYSVDMFVAGFFDRGAIKATLLTIDGNPPKEEIARLEKWWNRFFTGIKSAWSSAAVRMGVTPVTVGEGIQELSNTELTREKKEEIATGLGVPHSLVMSNAANYATSQQDMFNFYDQTIIPELSILFEILNEQLLMPQGLSIQHRADEMAAFQEDETTRSAAFKMYVDAGMKQSVAAQILGIDLPAGIEYEDLDPAEPEPEEAPPPIQVVEPAAPAQLVDNQDVEQEKARFRRWAAKRSHPDVEKFNSDTLSHADKSAILDALQAEKALMLQLDPDDDEAERDARVEAEARALRNIADGLRQQRAAVFPEDFDPHRDATDMQRRFRDDQKLRDALRRSLVEAADLGVSVGVAQLENIGFGFNWTLANTQARAWANRYAGELVTGINETTLRAMQQSIAEWVTNGEPLEVLVNELDPLFGRARAELIASTEVTKAYAEANRIAYQESGVVATMIWRTARDELVCPVCGPRNNTRAALNETFDGLLPPAHPRCRCWIAPYIEDQR